MKTFHKLNAYQERFVRIMSFYQWIVENFATRTGSSGYLLSLFFFFFLKIKTWFFCLSFYSYFYILFSSSYWLKVRKKKKSLNSEIVTHSVSVNIDIELRSEWYNVDAVYESRIDKYVIQTTSPNKRAKEWKKLYIFLKTKMTQSWKAKQKIKREKKVKTTTITTIIVYALS